MLLRPIVTDPTRPPMMGMTSFLEQHGPPINSNQVNILSGIDATATPSHKTSFSLTLHLFLGLHLKKIVFMGQETELYNDSLGFSLLFYNVSTWVASKQHTFLLPFKRFQTVRATPIFAISINFKYFLFISEFGHKNYF